VKARAKEDRTLAIIGVTPQSPRAAENPAAALALALCKRQCERLVWGASEGLTTQYGSSRWFPARTDSNSHASAPHKLMIQYYHLEHALRESSLQGTTYHV
jgi:hypothetical protein